MYSDQGVVQEEESQQSQQKRYVTVAGDKGNTTELLKPYSMTSITCNPRKQQCHKKTAKKKEPALSYS